MPYINRPYRKRPAFLEYISRYHDPEEDSPPITNFAVDLSPFPSHFLPSGCAIFPLTKRRESIRMQAKSGKFRPDTLIYATGYTQDFGLFDPEGNYPAPSDCDVRDVFKHGDESISFIGFVRPGVGTSRCMALVRTCLTILLVGAIPPLAEMQAMFWTAIIQGTISTPTTPPHYHLLQKSTARILYGVDHSSYMATLAKDLGAAPSLLELWVQYGWHVLICYWYGSIVGEAIASY
jgi:dimethylaniline monooxygenase (N-oxide forming)